MTKEEFDSRWKDVDPDALSEEEMRQLKQDRFAMYEESGFLERLDSPYDDDGHNGMRFEVLRRGREYNSEGTTEEERGEVNLETMPVWLVRFSNGDEALCHPEEICKAEHESPSIVSVACELEEFIKEKPGTTRVIHLPNWSEEDPEDTDPVHATVMSHPTGKAVLLHWNLSGDWTKALLLPGDLFDEDDLRSVQEAVEWFDR